MAGEVKVLLIATVSRCNLYPVCTPSVSYAAWEVGTRCFQLINFNFISQKCTRADHCNILLIGKNCDTFGNSRTLEVITRSQHCNQTHTMFLLECTYVLDEDLFLLGVRKAYNFEVQLPKLKVFVAIYAHIDKSSLIHQTSFDLASSKRMGEKRRKERYP